MIVDGVYVGAAELVMSPDDPEVSFAAAAKPPSADVHGTEVYRSDDGGDSWRKMSAAGAAIGGRDNYYGQIIVDPDDSDHMLLGYDYGMAITWDGGNTWYHPDELPMAQLYAVGYDMDFPYNVYGGMQDFGSWRPPMRPADAPGRPHRAPAANRYPCAQSAGTLSQP